MRRSKKIIVTVCVILCFSVAFMVTCCGYSSSTNTIRLVDSWGLEPDFSFAFGSLTQIATDGRTYTYNFSYDDEIIVSAIEDDVGRVGFLFEPFAKIPSGYTKEGTFILQFYIPWADYLPTEDDPWVVTDININYRMFLAYYTDSIGNYTKYSLTDASADIYSSKTVYEEGELLDTNLLYLNADKTYCSLRYSGNYVSTAREFMKVSISWKGKPSVSFDPFISFEFDRAGTFMKATPFNSYFGDVNDQINSDLNDIKNGLAMDEPNVDSIIDNLTPALVEDADKFIGSGRFYTFIGSMAVVGVSIGSIGYILHGKKE